MIELFNYFLICLGLLILFWVLVRPTNKRDTAFVRISSVFMAVFFLVPALMFIRNQGYVYLDRVYVLDDFKLLNTLICFYFFLIGFFFVGRKAIEFALPRKNILKRRQNFEPLVWEMISRKRFFLLTGLTIFILFLNVYMQPSADFVYDVRRQEANLSPLYLFLSIIADAAAISLFFLLVKTRWRMSAIVLILFLIATKLGASSGRTSILLFLSVAGVYLLNLRASTAALFIPVLFLFGFPIILIGKSIIYTIAVEGEAPNLSQMSSAIEDVPLEYFHNFAHPFISMYEVFGTIDIVGFRYFYDIFHGFIFYLKVFGLDMGSSITYYNTENLIGLHESIIPAGYLAFGFIQAGYLGALVMGLFFRYCYRFLTATRLFFCAESETLVFYMSFVAANTFYSGEMRTLALGFFVPLIVMHLFGKYVQTNVALKAKAAKP